MTFFLNKKKKEADYRVHTKNGQGKEGMVGNSEAKKA